uniref:Uncharacterized protein n=1 Tax=Romanomermis culicivorax TaxID=13658 RepID=A0A915KZE2_ROMCU
MHATKLCGLAEDEFLNYILSPKPSIVEELEKVSEIDGEPNTKKVGLERKQWMKLVHFFRIFGFFVNITLQIWKMIKTSSAWENGRGQQEKSHDSQSKMIKFDEKHKRDDKNR